nr:hypothetical protein [Tanacetum cinerariifolium]
MKIEAGMSREAWVRATDASGLVHGEVMSLRTTVLGHMSEIRELQAADRMRQTVISKLLRIDHIRSTEISELRTALQGQVTSLQGQVTALQEQVTTLQGQQGLARDHIQSELPEEAGGITYGRMKQMAPRRTTRSTADQETVNATTVTNAQLQTMIDQGVTAAFAARDALRSTNGDDSHNSRTGETRSGALGAEVGESSPNPTTSNSKDRNHRRSKKPFSFKESPLDTLVDQRTMAELLRAPTEGYAEAIVVPPILAEHFELKHSLINMMTSDQFFELEKDNPHDHIRWFNKITSTIKYKDVPNSAIKLMLFPFSLARGTRRWLKKEPPRSILTWEDLVWDRYKDLLHACPYHGFIELHQLDNFYNALNPADQDSLNSAAGGNLLERCTQDVLAIIENKSKQTSALTTAMTVILKHFQATPPSASIKSIEEVCVTCGGAHPYYQCLAIDGNTFPEFWDNIQGYVLAAAFNYNQGSGSLLGNTIANPKGELKAITTRSGLVLDGPSVPMPPPFINPEEDERVEETLTDPKLAEYTIKVPPPLVQKAKPPSLINYVVHQRNPPVILKKLPEKLGDPGKFLIPCGFSELKCKALAGLGNDDLLFDIEFDLREIEYLLNHDPTKEMDSILEDSVDEGNLADPNIDLVDTIPEMFIDEHTLDYSSPPLYDDVDDDIVELESDNNDVYDDPFDS